VTDPVRLCACPCKEPLTGMKATARFRTRHARPRHYRERKATRAAVTSQRPRKPSGLQVSYRKMVDVLEDYFTSHGAEYPRNMAVNIAREALSDRQRAVLQQRKRAQQAPTLTTAEQRKAYEETERAA
jgi:hypothetical protein